MKTEERTPAKDDPAFDIMRPGGKNSPYNKDGTPKPKVKTKPKDPNIKSAPPHGRRPPKKPPTGPKGGDSQRKEDLLPKPMPPKTRKPKYNPFGPGTANPSNMSTSTGP